MIQRISAILIISVLFILQVFGQADSLNATTPYVFSIEEDILNLKVQSTESRETYAASRSQEDVFKTVSSAYVITAEEIKQSGAINLGEALRLVPGVLVKQKTNGSYDVYLRGTSGQIDYQARSNYENTSVLLTIDGIPFNNWFQGGILWESIPIELNDIRQIEVVTTPNTALFGPNAATGSINIVTKQVEEKSLLAKVGLQGSINEDYAHRGSASFGVGDQLKFRVSAHYNRLTRFQDAFYLINEQRYIQSDSLLHYQASAQETNQSAEKSLRNHGVNAFATYKPNSDISVEAMVSNTESHLQSVLQPLDRIALTNRHLKANTFAVRTQLRNFRTNVSYQSGAYNMAVGYEGFKIRTGNLFASTEYDYAGQFYQVKVGGDINHSTFENALPQTSGSFRVTEQYADQVLLGTHQVYNTGLFISQNVYLLNRKWRWLATVRADRLNITDQLYGSYRVGSTYKIGKMHLLRANASYGLGNFSAQNYLSYDQTSLQYEANQNLRPLEVQTYEVGYRVVPYSDLLVELTYFHNRSANFIDFSVGTDQKRTNSNLTSLQQGVTFNVRGSVNKLEATAFISVQDSKIVSEALVTENSFASSYFGGVTGSYRAFLNKPRFNTSFYFYSGSQLNNPDYQLSGKLVTNCKISYNVWDEHVLFFNGRNVLNSKKIESPFADQIKSLYMVGIDLAF